MRAIHEHDCDQHTVGVCTCGAFLKCSRMGNVPGLAEHTANLKKLKLLLEREQAEAAVNALAADRVQLNTVPAPKPDAGDPNPNV